jgi:uncharacterized protein
MILVRCMSTTRLKEIKIFAGEKIGSVSGLLLEPSEARAFMLLAHGAGAGMRHPFMEQTAAKLADLNVATLRYNFPYMEKSSKRPDSQSMLIDTVRAAVAIANEHSRGLPLFAAGKSMGGRMTSLAAAQQPLTAVRGLIFFGFPLHAAGRPGAERAQHLFEIEIPMLFLQGSRDSLAELKLVKPLCAKLGKRTELFVIEGADHSFHMLKSSGRSNNEVLDEAVEKAQSWIERRS